VKRLVLSLSLLVAGCPGAPFIDHLAGVPLGGAPYFHHVDVFVEGQSLYAAIDPIRYPDKIGKKFRVHVVRHKSASQWAADPSLVDVTGAVETATLTAGSLSSNRVLVWPSVATATGAHLFQTAYDVVLDFNHNGKYDPKVDVIDRIGVLESPGLEETGGFTAAKDPATTGDFAVGTHAYDGGSFAVTVPAVYQEAGDPKTVNLVGKLYYPATMAGTDTPVSTALAKYPLVVIAHGRHGSATDSYLGYDYLGQHLASRGFVCASVALHQLWEGWRIHHRGVTILRHLSFLLSDTTADAVVLNVRSRTDPQRVGLLGHSRGGEGVAAAQAIAAAASPAPPHRILAVATFSPTDGPNWSETSPGPGPYTPSVPYLTLYGTADGDLSGYAGNTGIRVADRAPRPRHTIAIYGANHNFFNSTWGSDGAPTITRPQQETLARAFMTPFFSQHLLGHQAYVELLSGYVVPPSVTAVGTTIQFSDEPLRWVHLTVDDSQDAPAGAATNSLGEPNAGAGTTAFVEESLRYAALPLRNYYTHGTDGLRASWGGAPASVSFGVGGRSVLFYEYLSFRVAQRFRSTASLNPAGQPQTMSVTLSDTLGHVSPPVVASLFKPIPFTSDVGTYTKSILQTIRIPLRAFTANGSPLDLRQLAAVRLAFDQTPAGELIFDDVEFLGLDLSESEIP